MEVFTAPAIARSRKGGGRARLRAFTDSTSGKLSIQCACVYVWTYIPNQTMFDVAVAEQSQRHGQLVLVVLLDDLMVSQQFFTAEKKNAKELNITAQYRNHTTT